MTRAIFIHGPRDIRAGEIAVPDLGPKDIRLRIGAGGICGSDLHYYQYGGFGTIRIQEPMIPGHEIAGTVEAVGSEVSRVKSGDLIAVNPSRSCGVGVSPCRYCAMGLNNQCLDMRFYGSAMRFPHIQGGFRAELVIEERQAEKWPANLPLSTAAFAEPLAVCLHGVKRAGSLLGKRVLITGCGPIGALTLLAARLAGAAEIIVSDIADAPLAMALKLGADHAIQIASDPQGLRPYFADKGSFDVLFEASGNQRALVGAFEALAPRAIIVQLGLGGDFTLPINTLVAKEFDLRGTFRFHEEFAMAVQYLASGRLDVTPLLSAIMPVEQAREAFELAGDKSLAMKVQLSF